VFYLFLSLLAMAVAIQCFYAIRFFMKIYSLPVYDIPQPAGPVSIIICARNEAANLAQNIPQIMAQRYANEAAKPLFEVIVVNDCSTDNTEQLLQDLEQQYDNLWHVTISSSEPRSFPGKKFALSEGLKHAAYKWLLLTDADCAPVSHLWLQKMVAPLAEGKEIVAGYGKYRPRASLLNAFTRWETLHTFLQYSSYTLAGKPYMAVGRNLACTKEVLEKAQATEVWGKLPSGDDDLLVNAMATKDNMAIVVDSAAFTITDAKAKWSDWIRQKQRHLSTGKYYRVSVKRLLAGYGFSHALSWICFFGLLSFYWPYALLIMGIRSLIYWCLWIFAAQRLQEKAIIPLFPLFDMGWMIYNFAFSPFIFLKNKMQWR
jgi:glycosyltransferase involved in cell wall biosynthesis